MTRSVHGVLQVAPIVQALASRCRVLAVQTNRESAPRCDPLVITALWRLCRAATLLLSHFCGWIDYELTGSSTNHRASLVKLLCFGTSCSKTWKESNAGAANWNKNGMPLNCGRRWQQCVRAYFGHISSLHCLLPSNRAFCAFGFGQEREEDLLQDVMRLRTELARRSEAAEADPGKRLFADTMSEVSPNLNRSGRASRELPKITPVTVKELPPSG
jgi:hypothetical protein